MERAVRPQVDGMAPVAVWCRQSHYCCCWLATSRGAGAISRQLDSLPLPELFKWGGKYKVIVQKIGEIGSKE